MRSVVADWLLPAVDIVLSAVCGIVLIRIVVTLGTMVPYDYNEGWNAYFASAAMAGKSLYPPAQSFMVNNYPPLSFYLVGLVGRALGDNIVAGRILSLVSLLAVVCAVFASLRIMACKPLEAWFAVLSFAAYLLCKTNRVGMDDPNLLGLAVSLGGFVLLLREPRRTSALLGAALLFTLAFFIKDNLIVLPLVMTAWLAFYDRRSSLRLALFGLVLLIAGLAFCRFGLGVDLIAQLHSPRVYSLRRVAGHVSLWLSSGFLPLLVVTWLVSKCRDDKYVVLCAVYALGGFLIGAAFLGGFAVDVNAMFDCDIALVIGAGLALNRLAAHDAIRTGAIAAAFVLPLAYTLTYDAVRHEDGSEWLTRDFWLQPMAHEAEVAARDIALLRAQRGPVLCQTLALCYWADKPAEVDVFNTGQQFVLHARSDGKLVSEIRTRRFAVMQFETLPSRWATLGPRVRKAIVDDYRVDHNDEYGIFLVPSRTDIGRIGKRGTS